jgi:hypothetical protein
MFPVLSLRLGMSCFGSLHAGFAVPACTSLKATCRLSNRDSFQVIKSWEVVEGGTTELSPGARVGVSWMGGVDGDC